MKIFSIFIALAFICSCGLFTESESEEVKKELPEDKTGETGTVDSGTDDNGSGDIGSGDSGSGDSGSGSSNYSEWDSSSTTIDPKVDASTVGYIQPSHVSKNNLINDVVNYYSGFKNYMKPSKDGKIPGGYYLEADSSAYVPPHWKSAGQVPKTNSEATGYAMIIAAFMENRAHVDGLFQYFDKFKSPTNNVFMSWIIPESEDTNYRDNSATDGDLDIAYALLVAHDKWGSDTTVNYLAEATAIIKEAEKVLIADNNAIRFGDWCASSSNNNYSHGTRSSDWLVGHFTLFEKVTGNRIWTDVINTIYDTIIPNVMNSSTGLVPDFVTGNLQTPTGTILEDDNDKDYDWNACRYPWRQSVAYEQITDTAIKEKIKANLDKVALFAGGVIGPGQDFSRIKSGYSLDGTPYRTGVSNAYVAPMVCSFGLDPSYQDNLNKGWDYIKRVRSSYYPDAITMLSMLHLSGIWQQPLSGRIKPATSSGLADTGSGNGSSTPKELIINGDFSNGQSSWYDWYGNYDGNGVKQDTATYSAIYSNNEAEINISDLGDYDYSIGMTQNVGLVNGKEYSVSMDIASSVPRDIEVKCNKKSGDYTKYASNYFSLPGDSTYHRYTFTFTMVQSSDNNCDLGIMLGNMSPKVSDPGIIKIDNVSLIEK